MVEDLRVRRGLFAEGDEVDGGGGVEFGGEGSEAAAEFGGDVEEVGFVAAGDDDHEVAEEFDGFGEDLFDAHAGSLRSLHRRG